MESEFLKPSDVAIRLGAGRGRICQMIRATRLPATRVGSIHIPRTAWNNWTWDKAEEATASLTRDGGA